MTALDIDYFIPPVSDDLCQTEDRAHAVKSGPSDWMESDGAAPEHFYKRSIRPADESYRSPPRCKPRKKVAQKLLASASSPCIVDKKDFHFRTPHGRPAVRRAL